MQDFIDYLHKYDSAPARDSDIVPDGVDHFIQLEKDRSGRRLGYCLAIEPDGFAHGNFFNFDSGVSDSWHSKLEPGQKKIYQKVLKQADEKRKARAAEVAAEAQEAWIFSSDCDNHPYLVAKGVKSYGLHLSGENLLVPAYRGGQIVTMQKIQPNGFKLFMEGGTKKGAYFTMAGAPGPVLICEGYATGASLHEATGYTVIVAFDAYNLSAVAEEIKDTYPESVIIFCADNDKAGLEQAEKAARIIKAFIVHPDASGDDFNDVHSRDGLEAVAKKIQVASESPPEKAPLSVSLASGDLQTEGGNFNKWDTGLIYIDKHETVLEPRILHNAVILIRGAPTLRGVFKFNEFKSDTFICRCPPWDDPEGFKVRRLENVDLTRCEAFLESQYGMRLGAQKVSSAIEAAAEEFKFHPVREYFSSLEWDGVLRLDTWLQDYAGAIFQPPEYTSKLGKIWMVAGVARMMRPGCKFDHMLVLEGPQNAGKSMLFREIGTFGRDIPETYYTDSVNISQIEERGSILKLQGNLIIEFPELAGMGKKDQNELKRWITIQDDEVEVKHKQRTQFLPRQFILGATYNPIAGEGWINDPTGGRRFWPIRTGAKLNIEGLKLVREQLWAEAVWLYRQGMNLYVDDKDPVYAMMQQEQADRADRDIWTDAIYSVVQDVEHAQSTEILSKLGIEIGKQDRNHKSRVTKVMMQLGWEYKTKSVRGQKMSMWVRPEGERA